MNEQQISVNLPKNANTEVKRVFKHLPYSRNSKQLGHSIARCFLEAYNPQFASIFLQESHSQESSSSTFVCIETKIPNDSNTQLKQSDFHKTLLDNFNNSLDSIPQIWHTDSSSSSPHLTNNQSASKNPTRNIALKLGSECTLSISSDPVYQGYLALSFCDINDDDFKIVIAKISEGSSEFSMFISQLLVDSLKNEFIYGLWLSFIHDVKHFTHRADAIACHLEDAKTANISKFIDLTHKGNSELKHRAEMMEIISKHQTCAIKSKFENCDLLELLNATVITHQDNYKRKDVLLRIHTSKHIYPPIQIEAVPSMFVMLLHNLLDNALRYAPTKSIVEIKLGTEEYTHKISISNQGERLSLEEENKIQSLLNSPGDLPFGRIEGIGLIASKLLAQLHCGSLKLEKNPEYATCFAIYIPRK